MSKTMMNDENYDFSLLTKMYSIILSFCYSITQLFNTRAKLRNFDF